MVSKCLQNEVSINFGVLILYNSLSDSSVEKRSSTVSGGCIMNTKYNTSKNKHITSKVKKIGGAPPSRQEWRHLVHLRRHIMNRSQYLKGGSGGAAATATKMLSGFVILYNSQQNKKYGLINRSYRYLVQLRVCTYNFL